MKHYDVLSHRIATILKILGERGYVSVSELCAEFNVSQKTIYRDIKRINNPHISIKNAQVKLAQQNMQGSINEQIAFFVLKSIAKDLSGEVGQNALMLLDKLHTKSLSAQNDVFFTKTLLDSMKISAQSLYILQCCITQKQMMSCVFHKRKRYLAPIKIAAFDGEWYIFALEGNKNITREFNKSDIQHWVLKNFYLNDMSEIESLQTHFSINDDMLDSIDGALNAWFHPNGKKIFVRLWVNKKAAKYFIRKKISPKAQIFIQNDGSVVIELFITHFLEISGDVLKWIPYVIVLEPKELRDYIKQKVEEYLKILDNV